MKKMKTALLVTAAMLLLAGCGDNEKVISGEGNRPSSGNVKQENGASAAAKGYTFEYQGVTIGVDVSMAPVLEALGEPMEYFEAESCAFEGMNKIYTYNSFVVETYPDKEKDLISRVILKDDSVATPEGIAIGDGRARVEEIYGTDGSGEGNSLAYSKDGMKLCFIFNASDDSVISIEYLSTALD